jgi:hypothetical protein
MRANAVGLMFTAASDAAVAAFDRAVEEYRAFGRNTGRYLKDALAADAEMVMSRAADALAAPCVPSARSRVSFRD